MNDDIEKRVLVNKDGSLSVEMRVRFRLHNDQTIQWSTQVKESPSLTHGCPLSQAEPHDLQQGQSESCSDPEGGDYSSQRQQRVLEGNNCPCCSQRLEQQYDLWENPAHRLRKPPAPPPHASSRTHTATRHTHSSCRGGAAESHSTAGAEETDRAPSSRSKTSRASCRSSKASVANSEEEGAADDEDVKRVLSSLSGHTELSLQSSSVCLEVNSNSGASQKSHLSKRASPKRSTPLSSQEIGRDSVDDGSGGSVWSTQSNGTNLTNNGRCSASSDVPTGSALSEEIPREAEGENTVGRARSSLSGKSSASAKTVVSVKIRTEEDAPIERRPDSVPSAKSNGSAKSGTSHKSTCSHCASALSPADEPKATGQEEGIEAKERAASVKSAKSSLSAKSDESHKSTKAPERSLSPRSGTGEGRAASQRSGRSVRSPMSCETNNEIVGLPSSKETEMPEDEQHRCESVTSARSASSAKSGRTNTPAEDTAKTGDRSLSATSEKSHTSVKSTKSQKSNRTTAAKTDVGTADDNVVEVNAPQSKSQGQMLSPRSACPSRTKSPKGQKVLPGPSDGETRGPSALSVTSRNSGDDVTENQAIGRPAGEANGKEEMADDKSPCGLRPENKGEDSVKEHKAKSSRSVKTSSSQKKEMKSSSPRPAHSPRPGSGVEAPSEGTPSPSLSAADTLKETSAAARPHGRQSKAGAKATPEKRAKSRNRADPEALDPPPARLPDASPNEVVGDWLRSIPANSGMLALGDELQEEAVEEKPGEEKAKEEEAPERVEEQETAEAKEGEEKDEEQSPGDAAGASSRPNDTLPRNVCSSAAVMKVLLSSSLGRCRSMPEVSQ